MRIAIINEESTCKRNPDIIAALDNRGLTLYNVGMTGVAGEQPLSYINTSFMTALLLDMELVDLVVGGCGTGQGYAISTNMYPGVYCGLIYDPLEAWLFMQINAGNVISLALNKGFGWAGSENLRFIFDSLFSAPAGRGYPPYRSEPQKAFREKLEKVSVATHQDDLSSIMKRLEPEIFRQCANNAAFLALVKSANPKDGAGALFLQMVQ